MWMYVEEVVEEELRMETQLVSGEGRR